MPERAVRFGIANHDRSRKAATWRCWTNLGRDNSVYLTCRELQGSLHLSFHDSGRWHVAFASEKFEKLFEEASRPESRFAGQWLKPQETAPGLVLACRIHTPWYAVTSSNSEGSKDIVWIDAPPQASMSEVCVFLAAPGTICTNWPGSRTMHTALVGSFDLANNARVWIVSRNIPLAEPVLPPTVNPRFFKGADEQSLSVETLRAVVWGNADDGSVGFFESPVRVQRNNS